MKKIKKKFDLLIKIIYIFDYQNNRISLFVANPNFKLEIGTILIEPDRADDTSLTA